MYVEQDKGVGEGKLDQFQTIAKMGSERKSKTVTKTAKGEPIVWLEHAKVRTKDNVRKVVAFNQSLMSWVYPSDVGAR